MGEPKLPPVTANSRRLQDLSTDALRAGRRLAIFGAGLALHQLRRVFPETAAELIIDDRLARAGAVIDGVPVVTWEDSAARLDPERWFVLICAYETKSVRAIRQKLLGRGFRFPADMVDVSVVFWPTIAERLRKDLGVETDDSLFRQVHCLGAEFPVNNATSAAGTALVAHLINHTAAKGTGDVCELGVYQGGNAFSIALLVGPSLRNRKFFLLDSFEGLQTCGDLDPQSRAGDFADVELRAIRDRFAFFPDVAILEGRFSATLARLSGHQFCMAHVDCDLYEPAAECLAFLTSRLQPGGLILLHDYVAPEWEYPQYIRQPFRGIAQVVEECVRETGARAVVFPETTHVALVPKDCGASRAD
jgi:hypothetical protein